ncbi:hypothetical protein SODALDRAFT_268436 [Sodiomyces alkalinus F11]|uniref:WD40 repeat-like protein n=1 Tax=Sodiomyces alkalinus (strain CBS 110278 / VKM F-3762 / F11) TaxID=1314773 RepID=A0A3N2Q8M3_SODAK|nr:hypothetical protein SODALDRAFT_268436 [Sodiomyces alkalinus F11]ROT42998.1 hypothetical protein SODALDRAFT_268436 [Sodiomyces alkalinus F11]
MDSHKDVEDGEACDQREAQNISHHQEDSPRNQPDGPRPFPAVQVVASTEHRSRGGDTHSASPEPHDHGPQEKEYALDKPHARSFYRGVQWTADGTAVVASTSDHRISVHVLPEDLLAPKDQPFHLEPDSQLRFSEPSYAFAVSPYFSLSEPLSQTVLVSCKDHPIQLHHLFPDPPASASSSTSTSPYKLIRRETEAYISAESLLWTWPGTHFLVGSVNRLDYFDITRTGSDGPALTIPTIPSKRHLSKGGGVGMKGMVSALASQSPAVSDAPLVAAGTWTRWLGLYDPARSNKAVANWSIRGVVEAEFGHRDDDGGGVVQTLWSPCGRYLAVNERQASGILVYDVRGTGRPVNLLIGRDASTQQRLSCDVFAGSAATSDDGGFELWAGSKDGRVLVWEGVGARSGTLDESWDFRAHQSPVGGTMLHPGGSVVATCSGAWTTTSDDELVAQAGTSNDVGMPKLASPRLTDDCNLKIWALGMDDDALDDAEKAPEG